MNRQFHRRNLPHLHSDDGIYFVTFRLANTIPHAMLDKIKCNKPDWNFEEYKKAFLKYDSLLNNNEAGVSYLSQKEISDTCKMTLHYPDGKDYKLICYCIMPNHIHFVFELLPGNKGLSKIMQSVKGISSRECNLILQRDGKFWQDESYDRLLRNEVELYFVIKYVLINPVESGLVNNWQGWEYTYCHKDYVVL